MRLTWFVFLETLTTTCRHVVWAFVKMSMHCFCEFLHWEGGGAQW